MATFNKSNVVQPGQSAKTPVQSAKPNADEQALLDKIHAEKTRPKEGSSHLKTLKPLSEQAPPIQKDPVITTLASNDDLNVETIARQANKKPKKQGDDEVVISLR
jgi:hypothetical protein